MSTVCASSLLRCLVDLDVLDDEVGGIEALGVGIGFGVLEETEEELGGLDWPAGTGDAHLLAWRDPMLVAALVDVPMFACACFESASVHHDPSIVLKSDVNSPCAHRPVPPA